MTTFKKQASYLYSRINAIRKYYKETVERYEKEVLSKLCFVFGCELNHIMLYEKQKNKRINHFFMIYLNLNLLLFSLKILKDFINIIFIHFINIFFNDFSLSFIIYHFK